MDRYWLLTWTTYGTWLPGDRRGFVSTVDDGVGPEVRHNIPGTPYDADMPGLKRSAKQLMKGAAVLLSREQARVIAGQFRETANFRGWRLAALAAMPNHAHLVVGVPGDPDPSALMRDFKSYASRALNARWARPDNGTWWTESGSKRKLPHDAAVLAAIRYVEQQPGALVVWTDNGERPA